jgi:hypothetical protein
MAPGESQNPFVFDRPLEDGHALVGRAEELARLRDAIARGGRAVVEGAHQHGKTSLVNVALAGVAGAERALAVRVDCAGVLTEADLAQRLEAAYAGAWADGETEAALVERLDALSFRTSMEGGARLAQLLAVPQEVAERCGCDAIVCFDDFPDALAIENVADKVESAAGGHISYVYAGAELASRQLVADEDVLSLGVIDPSLFAEHIALRFEETARDAGEAANAIATIGAGHPQRTSLLAAQLWELTGEGERATVAGARVAIEQALVRCAPEFEVRWQALHSNERRVAVALARELAPQGTRAQRATGLAGYGAAQRALQGLKSSGVARADQDRTTLTDPLFAAWLRQRYERIPAEPGWEALRRMRAQQRLGISRRM